QSATSFEDQREVGRRAGDDRFAHRHGIKDLHGHLVAGGLAVQLRNGHDIRCREQGGNRGVWNKGNSIQGEALPFWLGKVLVSTSDRKAHARHPGHRSGEWLQALVDSRGPGEEDSGTSEAERAASSLSVDASRIKQVRQASMRDQRSTEASLDRG